MARSPDDWLRNSMKTGFVTGTVAACGSPGKMADDRSHLPATSSPLRSSTPFGSMSVSRSAIAPSKDLLAERGLDVSYETVWLWVLKFGCRCSPENFAIPRATARWHLDESVPRKRQ
jgi:hypothetical protein